MNRKELYTDIISTILSEHSELINNVDDVRDELDVNGLENALTQLRTNSQEDKLKYIAESMINKYNEEELVDYEKYSIKKRDFSIYFTKKKF